VPSDRVDVRRRLWVAGGAGLVLAGLAVAWVLPPAARALSATVDPLVVRGSVHVHTRRSDGTGTVTDVARAARRAGLQFVIVTDHGDGTRMPDAPAYRDGVLCLDGVEISAEGGHYVALGLGAAPYRLAGEPRDIVEDVRRLGGVGIVAHPVSPKDDLRWRDWSVPFEGIEWLNADSEWRDERAPSLLRALVAYGFRAPETIAALFDRPTRAFERWDEAALGRPVVGLAGHDAHARVGLRGNWEPAEGDVSLRLPSYEAAFRAFAVSVTLDAAPSGDAARDAAALLRGIAAGRVYTTIHAVAGPADFTFEARDERGGQAAAGGSLAGGTAAEIEARASDLPGASVALFRNGRRVAFGRGPALRFAHDAAHEPAIYRAEVHVAGAPGVPPVPWVVGNQIAIGRAPALRDAEPGAPTARAVIFDEGDAGGWRVEHDPRSRGTLAVVPDPSGGRALQLSYGLADGAPSGQYAALVAGVGQGRLADWHRLALAARASAEMRLSVQVRVPATGARWVRSVVIGVTPRTIVVPFTDMRAVGEGGGDAPLASADSVLFVVDTTHTAPGTRGTVWIDDLRLERE
jgi:hypothetical protein